MILQGSFAGVDGTVPQYSESLFCVCVFFSFKTSYKYKKLPVSSRNLRNNLSLFSYF